MKNSRKTTKWVVFLWFLIRSNYLQVMVRILASACVLKYRSTIYRNGLCACVCVNVRTAWLVRSTKWIVIYVEVMTFFPINISVRLPKSMGAYWPLFRLLTIDFHFISIRFTLVKSSSHKRRSISNLPARSFFLYLYVYVSVFVWCALIHTIHEALSSAAQAINIKVNYSIYRLPGRAITTVNCAVNTYCQHSWQNQIIDER